MSQPEPQIPEAVDTAAAPSRYAEQQAEIERLRASLRQSESMRVSGSAVDPAALPPERAAPATYSARKGGFIAAVQQLLPHDGGVGLVLDGRAEQLQLRRVSAVKLPDVSNRTRIFAR